MSIFDKYPSKGISKYLSMDELDFRHFLDRAGAMLPGFEKDDIRDVKVYLNPSRTRNPCS